MGIESALDKLQSGVDYNDNLSNDYCIRYQAGKNTDQDIKAGIFDRMSSLLAVASRSMSHGKDERVS